MTTRLSLLMIAAIVLTASHAARPQRNPSPSATNDAALDWPQWGGPARNFTSPVRGLAAQWSAQGPRRLWSRALGEGYSAISVQAGVLYTMYRQGNQEAIVALDAESGKTLWEHRYDAALLSRMKMENGPGPHSTPLVANGLVFTAGVLGKLQALDKKTGKVIWSHDLWNEYGGTLLGRGYSASPLAYKDTIIMPVGGSGQALMAFRQKDGSVAWKNESFPISNSSPTLINFEGQDQAVLFAAEGLSAVDPNNGRLLWSVPLPPIGD